LINKFKSQKAIPFLRWAGGKKWFIKNISYFLPENGFQNYHEPFLGGGAIYFYLNPKHKSFLNDLNSELIETYHCIKENVNGVLEELKKFKNSEDFYYKIRSTVYKSDIKRAARFIYLNQTSFNGIYRVNLKGEYNVPYGYRSKNFIEEDTLRLASDRLKTAKLTKGDFTLCLSDVKENDLVFLDPPYTISHNNNGFFKYNSKLFSKNDQYRLSEMIDEIKKRNAYYILTNAAHDDVKNIFNKGDYNIDLKRASLIGGKNAKRNKYAEVIITNCIK
jgi:DNA adenine methylase